MMAATNENRADAGIASLRTMAAQRAAAAGYAGDLSPREAWDYLSRHEALVVDVRTHPEWLFVGGPDMRSTPSRIVQIAWKTYPTFATNPLFAEQLKQQGIAPEAPLFFICRSGGRSLDAAIAATALGYVNSFNISGGFEGEPDARGQRGTRDGWKAANLPWAQG